MSKVTVLHLQIANGDSPEARDHRLLFANAGADIRFSVLHHDWSGDRESARLFEQASGAKVHTLDFGWRPSVPGRRRRHVTKLASAARFGFVLQRALGLALREKPDVIFSSQQRWDLAAATYLATVLRRPQIVHLHYTVGPWLGGVVLKRLLTCDHVIAVSDFIGRQARDHGVHSDRLTTIFNPVPEMEAARLNARANVRAELGIPFDAILLTIIARLDPDKGQADAIRALSSVANRHPHAWLLIVGDRLTDTGVNAETLEALAASLGVRDRIVFAGRQPFRRIPDFLAAADVFIHPSRAEPFGLATAEAARAGLPVIAYADGATPELVRHGETGLLARAGDLQGLAEHIDSLIGSPDTMKRMGEAAKHHAKEIFEPSKLGPKLANVILSVAHSQERGQKT